MNLLRRCYNTAPLLLVLATLGWAGNPIAGLALAGKVSPMLIVFLRWLLLVVFLYLLSHRQIRQAWPVALAHRGWVLKMGIFIGLFNSMFYLSANFTTAINIGILQSSIPLFILLILFIFAGQKIVSRQVFGVALTILGVVWVVCRGDWRVLATLQFNAGDLIMLTACLFYSGYAIGLKSRPEINVFVMMWFIALAAMIAVLPLAIIEAALGYFNFPSGSDWLVMLYIVVVPSYLSQALFMRGVDLVGPSNAGIYGNVVPIFTALLSILLLSETLHPYHLIALALVLVGILIFERYTVRG